MKSILGTESRKPARHGRWLLGASAALVVSGCVSPAFRESVGQFGEATKVAAAAQNERLTTLAAVERELVLDRLASDGIYLNFAPTCSPALLGQASTVRCTLVDGNGNPISQGPSYEHIIALDDALSGYGESLIALAADSTEDQAAFAQAVTAVGTSLSNLNNAIRTLSGAPEHDLSAPVGAVAKLVGELGNVYFTHRRNQVLRQVIREGAPAVRRAIALLRAAAEGAAQLERSALARRAEAAQDAATDLLTGGRPGVPALREAQSLVFDRLDALNRYQSDIRLFEEMEEAHDRLVVAAQRGASAEDLRLALNAIISLTTTAHNTVTALRSANGSDNNAN